MIARVSRIEPTPRIERISRGAPTFSSEQGAADTGVSDYDGSGSGAVIGIGAGAMSGFVMGLLVRGELLAIVVGLLLALFCGVAGWWARGLVS